MVVCFSFSYFSGTFFHKYRLKKKQQQQIGKQITDGNNGQQTVI